MDQDGLFLMLKMCNGCSHNKGSWKKCMSRRHNPRMSTVRKEELTNGHRQCVKPDQAITIFKLRDHETNEEFLEFDEQVIFQTACHQCLNIKSCLSAGHRLVDWRPTFAGGRLAGSPPSPSPEREQPADPHAEGSRRGMPPPPVAAPAATGKGGVKKGRGGGTPTRSCRGRSAAAVAATAAANEDGGGKGGEAAGRKGGRPSEVGAKQEEITAPKVSHKRKSPGSVVSLTGRNRKAPARPTSAGSPQDNASPDVRKGKAPASRRGSRGNAGTPGTGGSSRGRRGAAVVEEPDVATKMQIDTDPAEADQRPHKRRGRANSLAVVTPSPKTLQQDSFETSSAGENEEAVSSNGDAVDTIPDPPSLPPVPATVAEKLELVKSEEADLLRQFEDTHRRTAEAEKAKREEMEEFQRAGEAALRAMQQEKEEELRRISEERKAKAAQLQELLELRLKEFEEEEEASRIEAKERDARLEAERERLAKEAAAAAAAATATTNVVADGENGAAADGNGDRPPGWATDGWILAGAELKGPKARVAEEEKNKKTTAPYVKDEKCSAKAAAVAKLLAAAGGGGGAATATSSGGGTGEAGQAAGGAGGEDGGSVVSATEEGGEGATTAGEARSEGSGRPSVTAATSTASRTKKAEGGDAVEDQAVPASTDEGESDNGDGAKDVSGEGTVVPEAMEVEEQPAGVVAAAAADAGAHNGSKDESDVGKAMKGAATPAPDAVASPAGVSSKPGGAAR